MYYPTNVHLTCTEGLDENAFFLWDATNFSFSKVFINISTHHEQTKSSSFLSDFLAKKYFLTTKLASELKNVSLSELQNCYL